MQVEGKSDIDIPALAQRTAGSSGADLQALVSEAQLASVLRHLAALKEAESSGEGTGLSKSSAPCVTAAVRPPRLHTSVLFKRRFLALINFVALGSTSLACLAELDGWLCLSRETYALDKWCNCGRRTYTLWRARRGPAPARRTGLPWTSGTHSSRRREKDLDKARSQQLARLPRRVRRLG